MFLEIDNLHIKYGQIEAIHGVSFDMMEKEVATIIGANGAGKTTILKAIMGINRVWKGSIRASFGGEIQNCPPHKIAKMGIGYVPEGREILTRMTVEDNLVIGGFIINDKKIFSERINYVFDKFPILKKRSDQLGGALSGGEQQMLAIARALMLSPKIMLMDEPSLGLAPLVVNLVFELIRGFRNDGYSILLIEQNAKKALQISNRGYVLENGRVVVRDAAQKLLNNDEIRRSYLGS